MGLVPEETKRVDAPDGSGWVEIMALGWLALENARNKRIHQLADMAKMLKDITLPTARNGEVAAPEDLLMSYDKLYLLKHGVKAWSWADELNVERLDDPTAEWAAREILAYSVPGETELGKSSSLSTGTSLTLSGTTRQTNGS